MRAFFFWERGRGQIIELLLGAGADTTLTDWYGRTAEDILHMEHPHFEAALALFAQVPDSQQAAMLVPARRLVAASSNGLPSTQPAAKARGEQQAVMRRVELTPWAAMLDEDEEEGEGWEEEEDEEEEEGGGSSAGPPAAAAAAAVDDEDRRDKRRWEKEEEADKLSNLIAFVLGLGVGVEGQAVPQLPGCVCVGDEHAHASGGPAAEGLEGWE